jgi:hypothetical protein
MEPISEAYHQVANDAIKLGEEVKMLRAEVVGVRSSERVVMGVRGSDNPLKGKTPFRRVVGRVRV